MGYSEFDYSYKCVKKTELLHKQDRDEKCE